MRSIFTVCRKEILDNLRDRQTVFYALLFGPLLLPLIVAGSLIAGFKQSSIDFNEVTELSVINAQSAPNLISFLRQNNIDAVEAPKDYRERLIQSELELVLEVPENFSTNLRAARPAPLNLYSNEADKNSTKAARKITSLLMVYERSLDTLRLQARGLNPNIFNSLLVQQVDVSEDGTGTQILASMLPFLLIMSMVMGGFYLAIDTTAGERERLSLEPLLSLPINRSAVVTGKYLATLAFVTFSGFLTAVALVLLFRFFPSDALSTLLRFDPLTIAKAFVLALPLTLLITSLLLAVSAFTRSTKEAQTYLGILMIIPMAPFFLLQFLNIRSATVIMAIPMMSQYKLLEKVVKGETLDPMHVALSVSGTLICALLLLMVAISLYRRDRIIAG